MRPGLTSGFYSAFLTAQGRVLNDVFIYPAIHSTAFTSSLPSSITQKYGEPGTDTPGYIIEVDADEADRLLKHLKRYKLRSKLDIRLLDPAEWSLWSTWDDGSPWTPHSSATSTPSDAQDIELIPNHPELIGTFDARAPGMGRRLVLPSSQGDALSTLRTALQADIPQAPLAAYTVRRMLRGVAEGQAEISREHALPQESDMDYMGGIDFRKGCYVGQELTIRTHHTGVVRKRILPVQLYAGAAAHAPAELAYDAAAAPLAERVSAGANIMPHGKRGRSAGKWLAGVGNVGLALCRVEMMTDLVLTAEGSRWNAGDVFKLTAPAGAADEGEEGVARPSRETLTTETGDEVMIKAFVPDWIRGQVKVKKPNQRV